MFRYYKCAVCGKRGMDTSNRQNRKFCSPECSELYYRRKNGVGIDKEDRQYCQFNDGVECYQRKCGKCGWNPEVAKKRLEVACG